MSPPSLRIKLTLLLLLISLTNWTLFSLLWILLLLFSSNPLQLAYACSCANVEIPKNKANFIRIGAAMLYGKKIVPSQQVTREGRGKSGK